MEGKYHNETRTVLKIELKNEIVLAKCLTIWYPILIRGVFSILYR